MSDQTPKPDSGRKLFFGLFVFPLVIVAGMIAMVLTIVLLTHEDETPESLVAAIKTGSERKRWQKASELSNELNRRKPGPRDAALARDMILMLGDAARYDAKTRSYMAAALGHFKGEDGVEEALRRALSADADSEVRFYALWSIGTIGSKAAIPDILSLLRSGDEAVRVNAVYVLGAIGDPSSTGPLRVMLDDAALDVRWNAALSLARLGDPSGFPVLVAMLDRSQLEGKSLPEDRVERVMINAVKGLALIPGADSIKILESVSRGEKNLRVRQAAMDALAYQKNQDSGKMGTSEKA